ncbi:MAG: TRAP transporter small permease, partial [Betaproteobacteria bacterium]
MRPFLNALYDSAAALAALFMVLLLITVLSSILGRELHFLIPGTDAYAGYFMAG